MKPYPLILVSCICFVACVVLLLDATGAKAGYRYSAVAPADERYVETSAGRASRRDNPPSDVEDGRADPTPAGSIFARFTKRIIQTWESKEYDLYLPVYIWHNRLMYDSSQIKKYNEIPWGGGFGRSFLDEDGDSHSLYLMSFMDSNNYVQPIGGYAYIKNWYLDEQKDWSVGLGYTLSLTARHEYNYIPLPLPLPLFSVQYKQFAIQGTYIPSHYNDGNVLFTWLRWHFD